MAKKTTYNAPRTQSEEIQKEDRSNFPLTKINFILMAVSGLIIVIGFLLMIGSGSTTEQFNPDIFSTRRIVVGPTMAFLGFLFMGAAIVYRPRKKENNQQQ